MGGWLRLEVYFGGGWRLGVLVTSHEDFNLGGWMGKGYL